MVTVTNFKTVETKDGRSFISLELTSGLEMVQSSNTGKFYACVRKCNIPATFDEITAKSVVNTKIEGEIVRIPCEAYSYTIKATNEEVILMHTYGYQPTPSGEVVHLDRRELIEA